MEGYTKKRKVSCEMNFSKIDSSVMCHTVLHLWKGAKSQAPVLSRFLEEHPWLEINLAFFRSVQGKTLYENSSNAFCYSVG